MGGMRVPINNNRDLLYILVKRYHLLIIKIAIGGLKP